MTQKEYDRNRSKKRRDEIISSLGGKCAKCGTTEKLEVDHIDPRTKTYSIAKIYKGNREKLYIELRKCQLLCDPCHILKTIEQNGWKRAKGEHGPSSYSNNYCRCNICRKSFWQKRKEYQRKYKKGLLDVISRPWRKVDRKCDLCDKKHLSRGLCRTHYDRLYARKRKGTSFEIMHLPYSRQSIYSDRTFSPEHYDRS